jgi:hypothetical protein
LIPMALPLSPGLKTEVIIARLVPNIIALEKPCRILKIMSEVILREKIIRKVVMVKSIIPEENIFFLPTISPSLPNGRRKIADESMKLLMTHPRLIALALRSLPIAGNARFTAEPRKGVMNAAKVATIKTEFFDVLSLSIPTLIS